MNYPQMLLTGTPYSMLFYMLLNAKWSSAVFVFDENFPRKIIDKLVERGIECHFLFDDVKQLGNAVRKNNTPMMGHDFLSISKYFVNPNFMVIEDGLANYDSYEYVTEVKKAQYFLDDGHEYVPFGYDEMISKIYLTGKREIPRGLRPKVELIDLKSLWRNKTPAQQSELLNIFSFPMEQFKNVSASKRDQLLLTQRYFDLGILSLDEQLGIYKEILSRYDQKRIIIKPHPLDTIVYDEYFSDCMILDRYFPIEFFELLGIKIERTISINSSAQFGVFEGAASDQFQDIFERIIEPRF